MSLHRRDGGEIEALVTDRYLDSLLAVQPVDDGLLGGSGASVGAAVRAISRRLSTDLPRFHPSFRFEERLALRLAEIAASMRLPVAAGGESQAIAVRRIQPAAPHALVVLDDGDPGTHLDGRPLLIGGAVAASAISLAGAWLAWRRRTSPMARAIRAAHSMREQGA
ncbi:MAG: hypothetical protein ABI620_07170 [Chloroflexota bacterium]